MRKQACKNCKIFVEGEICPICKGSSLSTNWQGRISFLDVEKSFIARQIGAPKPGEYVLKVR